MNASSLALRESFAGPVCKLQWDTDTYKTELRFKVSSVTKLTVLVENAVSEYDLTAAQAVEAGLGRAFDIEAWALGENGLYAVAAATLSVSNSAPATVTPTVTARGSGVEIYWDWPAATDFAGTSVWVSDTDAFTPTDAELFIYRDQNQTLFVPVTRGDTRYIRVAYQDVWADTGLNFSSQITVAVPLVGEAEIGDEEISTPLIQDNAVTIPVFAFTDSEINPGGSWMTVQSITYTSVGDPVEILCSAFMYEEYSGGGFLSARLQKNGVTIFDNYALGLAYAAEDITVAVFTDTPSAGSVTYTWQVASAAGNMFLGKRYMRVLELKK
jgi:hypothetical protein